MNQIVLFGDTVNLSPRPTGIYVLASYLRSKGYTTQPIWGWNNINEEQFEALCTKYISEETRVVGLSTTLLENGLHDFYGVDIEVFEQRIKFIKGINPNVKIVIGGSKIRYVLAKNIPRLDLIDYVVKGQGESALLWVVENYDAPVEKKFIDDDEYKFDEFCESTIAFDEKDELYPKESMFFEFARGCIFKCSYCSYHIKGKKRNEFSKELQSLKQDLISNYEKFGIQYYHATDDLINDSLEKVEEIHNVFQQLPFKIQYSGYTRLDLIWRYPETAKMLKESGLMSTYFGIESINDKSAKIVGKGLGIERINEGLATCSEAWGNDVHLTCSFILGLPFHNPDTKYELMEWLDRPINKKLINNISVTPLHFHPEMATTELDANPGKFGYFYKSKSKTGPVWLPGVLVKSGDWYTKDYSFQEAVVDKDLVVSNFLKDRKFKTRLTTFNLPLFLSLSSRKDEILDVVMRDKSTFWNSDEEWTAYVHSVYANHKRNYLNRLLSV